MRIFTIRHGQTHWNSQRRIQGQTDIELDRTGIEQAIKLGNRLANEKVDVIYTSDLLRAYKTAEEINKHHGVEVVKTTALRETNFGTYEGRVLYEISKDLDHFRKTGKPFPGGEGEEEVLARVRAVLDEIVAGNNKTVFIVGHYGTVRAVMFCLLNVPPAEQDMFHIGNTAIHCYELRDDGSFHMTLENDMSHLKD